MEGEREIDVQMSKATDRASSVLPEVKKDLLVELESGLGKSKGRGNHVQERGNCCMRALW